MSIGQRIVVVVTLLAVAVFLFSGGSRARDIFGGTIDLGMDVGKTIVYVIGIVLVGGALTILLGGRGKRATKEDDTKGKAS